MGIIGIVAAMTLPVLTGKYQKQIKISQLKNIYSPMQQLDTRVKAEYGDTLNTYLPDSKEFFGQYLIPYLKPVKFCLSGSCPYYRISTETGEKVDMTNESGFILQDGTLFKIVNIHGTTSSGIFAMWLIDINGVKPPNKTNEDIYFAEFGINTDRTDGLTGKPVRNGTSLFYFPINVAGEHYDGIGSGCFREIVKNNFQPTSVYNSL